MMYSLIPMPKKYQAVNEKTKTFSTINFIVDTELEIDPVRLGKMRFWNYTEISFTLNEQSTDAIDVVLNIQTVVPVDIDRKELYEKEGYALEVENGQIKLDFMDKNGFINGLSTLKQLDR